MKLETTITLVLVAILVAGFVFVSNSVGVDIVSAAAAMLH